MSYLAKNIQPFQKPICGFFIVYWSTQHLSQTTTHTCYPQFKQIEIQRPKLFPNL